MMSKMIRWAAKKSIISSILVYQYTISIFLGPCCRFTPNCSSYARLAIERFGFPIGVWITLKRISKCHPFHPGGYDPVPETS